MTKAVEEVEADREVVRVFEWRADVLRVGGFTKRDANILAGTAIDWRYANQVLKHCKAQGYDDTFVMNLLV